MRFKKLKMFFAGLLMASGGFVFAFDSVQAQEQLQLQEPEVSPTYVSQTLCRQFYEHAQTQSVTFMVGFYGNKFNGLLTPSAYHYARSASYTLFMADVCS